MNTWWKITWLLCYIVYIAGQGVNVRTLVQWTRIAAVVLVYHIATSFMLLLEPIILMETHAEWNTTMDTLYPTSNLPTLSGKLPIPIHSVGLFKINETDKGISVISYPCEANSPEFCLQKQYNSTIENFEIGLNLGKARSRITDELGLPPPLPPLTFLCVCV